MVVNNVSNCLPALVDILGCLYISLRKCQVADTKQGENESFLVKLRYMDKS